MQKRLTIILSLLLSLPPQMMRAQTGCGLSISSDFNSDCVLTGYTSGHTYMLDDDANGCLKACKGNTVSYTAVCDNATSYHWDIMGATSYNLINQGKTAVVKWGTGETGHVIVSVVTANNNTCTTDACVKLLQSPQIASKTVPNYYLDNGKIIIEICRGETIELMDISSAGNTPITGFQWHTPMGDFSTPNCVITVPQTGEFVIKHEVQNECGCKAAEDIFVKVMEPAHLDLSCYGTVCEGTTANYSVVAPTCSQYIWNVEGGTYTTGPSPRDILIHWSNPVSGYGVITVDGTFCNACNAQISVKIPVITDSVEISGAEIVCVGDIQQYELPLWGATEYQWSNSENDIIQLFDSETPNKTLVKFPQAGQFVLSANYECEALECGPFYSTKTILVKDTLRIKSSNGNLCVGMAGSFTTNYGGILSWKIYGQDGLTVCSSISDTLTYTFSQTGKYKVVAYSTEFCNDAEFWVTVLENPPALSTTEGPHEACQHSTILLKGTPSHPRYYLEWVPVYSYIAPQSGNRVSFHYGAEICDVAVYQVDKEYGCRSTAYIHEMDAFSLRPHGLPAVTNVCPNDMVFFEVPDQSSNVLYKWTMEPVSAASATENFILPYVTIRTNHLTGIPSFTIDVILTRTYCGFHKLNDTVRLSVNNLPSPLLNYTDTVCQLDNVSFSAENLASPGVCSWAFTDKTFHGESISREFSTSGFHTFTFTYRPDSECDPFTFTDSVYVVASPIASISRHGDTLCVPAQQEVTYLWTYQGDTVSTGDFCIMTGTGDYCCQVSNTAPPYCTAIRCYRNNGSTPADSCLPIVFDTAVITCNTAMITATSPTNTTFIWTTDSHTGSCSPSQSPSSTTATFATTGNHYVEARTVVNGQCYTGKKYVTILRVPEVRLTYDCDSERIAVHDLSIYADNVIPNRTIALNGSYYTTIPSPNTTTYIPTDNFTEGTYTVIMTMADYGCTCSDSLHFKHKPQITNIERWTNLCERTPAQLHAHVTGGEFPWLWDYGDGSYAYDGTTYHTFSSGNATYPITVTVKNTLGCAVSLSQNFTVAPNNVQHGQLNAAGADVCPGAPKTIYFDNPPQNNTLYFWYQNGIFQHDTSDYEFYTTYETGDYKVKVSDQTTGCLLECLHNVGFLTAPTAHITGNTIYCLSDEVRLYGNSGATNTYNWTITGPEAFTSDSANISFSPSQPGVYHIILSVTGQNGCSATDSCTITVHPQPAAPSISFYGNECIHQPPVGVRSDNHQSLLWSNGYHGETAYYYTPGYLTALYIDDSTGCLSAKAEKLIPPAPHYDALLTGCYRKCPDDLPFCLPAATLLSLIPTNYRQIADSTVIDSTAENHKSLQQVTTNQPNLPYLAPNPAHNEVTVMGIAPDEVADISILTMQGQQVSSFPHKYRFNVNNLSKASYIVNVITTDGRVFYLKLVKQ